GLGHLHQREQRLLHPRPARGWEADIGNTLAQGNLGTAHETRTDHAAHGTAHEVELKGTCHQRHALEGALHDHQRVLLAGQLLGCNQAVLVFLGIPELELVDRLELCGNLSTAIGIQENIQTAPGADPQMVAALGANLQILFQLGAVQHGVAGRAFTPQPFGHTALLRLGTHDGRNQFIHQPVAHCQSLSVVCFTKMYECAVAQRSMAARISRMTAVMPARACSGSPTWAAIWLTNTEPTTTPSATPATAAAEAPSRIPKPTPIGRSVTVRSCASLSATSVTFKAADPVTPFSET